MIRHRNPLKCKIVPERSQLLILEICTRTPHQQLQNKEIRDKGDFGGYFKFCAFYDARYFIRSYPLLSSPYEVSISVTAVWLDFKWQERNEREKHYYGVRSTTADFVSVWLKSDGIDVRQSAHSSQTTLFPTWSKFCLFVRSEICSSKGIA